MTNERIDHAEKAHEVLAEIEQMDPKTQWVEMTQKQLVVTSHIGLASVEQQRVANLIALWTVSEADAEQMLRAGVNFGGIFTEIQEGLGI